MGKILSDISKRTLIIEGKSEKDRILRLRPPDEYHSVETNEIGDDLWQIEIVYKVGSYMRGGE